MASEIELKLLEDLINFQTIWCELIRVLRWYPVVSLQRLKSLIWVLRGFLVGSLQHLKLVGHGLGTLEREDEPDVGEELTTFTQALSVQVAPAHAGGVEEHAQPHPVHHLPAHVRVKVPQLLCKAACLGDVEERCMLPPCIQLRYRCRWAPASGNLTFSRS